MLNHDAGELICVRPAGFRDGGKDRQIEGLECQTGGEEAEATLSGNDDAGCDVTDFDNMRGMCRGAGLLPPACDWQ